MSDETEAVAPRRSERPAGAAAPDRDESPRFPASGGGTAAEAALEVELESLHLALDALRTEIGRVVVGQHRVVDHLLVVLLAGGHCLLEGVPGLAKTLLVRTLAQAVHLSFKRIQFTPDLMPSDILGTEILEEDHGTGRRVFRFNPGPIFANLVLADEINRSPPKTQAALLEAMQEVEVTCGGRTFRLERPFLVLATQNPIEQTGTYPLPEAALDRFLLHLRIDYPTADEELAILESTTGSAIPEVRPVLDGAQILRCQALAREVHLSRPLLEYAARLVRATRPGASSIEPVRRYLEWGAGPRAGQALILAAKARAFLAGRLAVTLEDLRDLAAPVLHHRLLLNFRGQAERVTPDALTAEVLAHTTPPASPLA